MRALDFPACTELQAGPPRDCCFYPATSRCFYLRSSRRLSAAMGLVPIECKLDLTEHSGRFTAQAFRTLALLSASSWHSDTGARISESICCWSPLTEFAAWFRTRC